MPSGKKDIYGAKSKALYKAGDMAAEMAVKRNAAASAKVIKTPVREGTTRPPEMIKPVKAPKVISTTVNMKSSPTTKRK